MLLVILSILVIGKVFGQPSPSEVPSGLTNNGAANAVVVWDTAGITPGTYWYNCQYHSTMWGNIVITS